MKKQQENKIHLEKVNMEESTRNMDKHYSESKFINKIKKTGGKLAQKALYAGLVLFYALKSPKLPQRSRLVIFGALGYFILPIDLVPDFLPIIGLSDDAAILIAALGKLYEAIDEETKEQARKKMRDWFGVEYESEFA
ncbi:YkvA family protein [Lederbergia lenta]|uniref:YkvA family protein n=1 Tax=Lederbergia lenta TaxID=1467 RepID=UPI00203ABE05|nr:YkvA family protein [Lederbergia lenta]MCM3111702.1 YkvA family protein [Lederbergia lenta]